MAKKKNNNKKVEEKEFDKEIKENDKSNKKNNKEVNIKKNEKKNDSYNLEVTKVVTVTGVILIIFCVFYFVTYLVTRSNTEKDDSDNGTNVATISYDNIILGRSFSMSDSEYYVLYYDTTDSDLISIYSSLASGYKGKEGALPLYIVNMGDALNKAYAGEAANYGATNASELVINGPTLIKYSNGAILEYAEGEETIRNYLG